MSSRSQLFIGVMSGTSMDGVDSVLLEISDTHFKTLGSYSQSIPVEQKQRLNALCFSGDDEIFRMGKLDVEFGEVISQAVAELLAITGHNSSEISAIGSHGQTIRHSPDSQPAFSLQIGNPSIIADRTSITTVSDFRMADIASGGQGAPLVPAFHKAAFCPQKGSRAIINIGGIANITILKPTNAGPVTGYDIGPGNTLLDTWVHKHLKTEFDKNGEWARTGHVILPLLAKMREDDYILRPSPKSTGKEYFNLAWLQHYLSSSDTYPPKDIQRTLIELTAREIAKSVTNCCELAPPFDVFLCGGGVNNTLLLERICALLPDNKVALTDKLGIGSQLVEAAAFAWLAQQTLSGQFGSINTVTGAKRNKILGGIYPA